MADGITAEQIISEWIGIYNTERPHSALESQTPAGSCDPEQSVDMMEKAAALLASPRTQRRRQQKVEFLV